MITKKNIPLWLKLWLKLQFKLWLKYFPALVSGMLLTLSFPDANISYLVFFALVPLLLSIKPMTHQESFYAGFITGFSYFLTLIYWIVPTVYVYGGLNLIFAVGILALLCMYLALYPAIFTFILKKIETKQNKNYGSCFTPLIAACLWVGLEYIRTYAFTGFPWGNLGYSQFANLFLIQIVDCTGIYGVSFLIILCNYFFVTLFMIYKTRQVKKYIIHIVYILVIFTGIYIYGDAQIHNIDSQITTAQTTKITIIQGNIKQDFKWDDEFKQSTIEKYVKLSKEQIDANSDSDLVVWPETALPFFFGFETQLTQKVNQCIKSLKTSFLIGSPAFESNKEFTSFYNRAYMIDETSYINGFWDKHHLIPFGEYVPFGKYLTFLGKITAQAGNFSPGVQDCIPLEFSKRNLKFTQNQEDTQNKEDTQNQENTQNLKIMFSTGVLICFEILFPSISSDFVKNKADILTTITNDAWFGYSSAAMQHFSIAVFRAVENRRSMVRAANTGISGFIDPKGQILETTPLFKDRAITRQIPILNQISFYTKYGDVFAFSSIFLFFIYLLFLYESPKK